MVQLGLDYIADSGAIWNVLDLWSSGMVIMFSIDHLTSSDEILRMKVVGALAVFSLWLKVFYFLRLFESTAAFISMIVEMLKDIRVFLLIFFTGIFAFANTYYVLDFGSVNR